MPVYTNTAPCIYKHIQTNMYPVYAVYIYIYIYIDIILRLSYPSYLDSYIIHVYNIYVYI